MNEQIWETFEGLFKTLHRYGRRMEELETRVVELERRLQERAAASSPREEFAARVFNNWPPNVTGRPDFAPLGVTLYDAQGNPTPILFPGAERRLVVLGIDKGEPGGDRAAVVLVKREVAPDAPDFVTRARVVSVKETPDRGKAEPEEA